MHDYELYHHGVKGMKWGVRKKRDTGSSSNGDKRRSFKEKRVEKKARKDVDRLHKALSNTESIQGRQFATMAAMSTTSKKDYERVAKAIDSGNLFVKASFKKNYKDKSVDLFFGDESTPTMKMRMEKGKTFYWEFVDKNRGTNYLEFMKYANERDS